MTPLFKLELEISEGVKEFIDFNVHDSIDDVAYNISLKYDLKNKKFVLLRKILQDNYNRSIEERRNKRD
jgi:hypothetical protein